jgi:hypothetical protein
VITQLAAEGQQVVLGVETVFARDQHLLDEWNSREIDGAELRERLRYDIEWGYDWFPFYRLLERRGQIASGFTGWTAVRVMTCARLLAATSMRRNEYGASARSTRAP